MYSKNILQIIIIITVLLGVNGCGGGGSSGGTTTGGGGASATISHNNVDYSTLTSSTTGRIWLDRNIGASQSCISSTDSKCYGDYYQWGRDSDGHEKADSLTTTTLASGITNAGSKFIISSENDKDWTTTDVDGSLREVKWSTVDGSSVCPIGYRIPTSTELSAEMLTNIYDAYTVLKIPVAGFRSITVGYEGDVLATGSAAYIYTTTLDGNRTYRMRYDSTDSNLTDYQHTTGYSIRCIQDESYVPPVTPPSTVTAISYTDIAGTWSSFPESNTANTHVYLTYNSNNSGYYTAGTINLPMTYSLTNNVLKVMITGNSTYSLDGNISSIVNGVMSFDLNYNGSIGNTDNWYKSTKVINPNGTATGFLMSYETDTSVSTSTNEVLVDDNGDMQISGHLNSSKQLLKLNSSMTNLTKIDSFSSAVNDNVQDIRLDRVSGNSMVINVISGTQETYLNLYNGSKNIVAQTNEADTKNTEIVTSYNPSQSKTGSKMYLPDAQIHNGIIQYKTKAEAFGYSRLHLYDTATDTEILNKVVEGLQKTRLYADGVMYMQDNAVDGYDIMLYNKNTQVTQTLASQTHMRSLCYTYASDANHNDYYNEQSSTMNNGLYDSTVIPGIMYKNPASSSESIIYYMDCQYATDVQYESRTDRLLVLSTPAYSTVLAIVVGGNAENVWMKERLDGSVIYAYNDDKDLDGNGKFAIRYFKLGSLYRTIATSHYAMRSNMLVTSKYVIYEIIDENLKTKQYIYDGTDHMPFNLDIPNHETYPIELNRADNSEEYMVTTDGYRNIYKIDIEKYVTSYKASQL